MNKHGNANGNMNDEAKELYNNNKTFLLMNWRSDRSMKKIMKRSTKGKFIREDIQ